MNEEKRKDEDIKVKAKLEEMQTHIPFLQEFLKSVKNGENKVVKQRKVMMVIEIITGKLPCSKLETLIGIEEVIRKIKSTKQSRVTQEVVQTLNDSKSSKDNASEVIDVGSSDDDDVEIVSCTAPQTISENNESVPDLTLELEKMDESVSSISAKNQISSNSQNKISMNLIKKESLTSVIPKTCDNINNEPISSVNKSSNIMAEVSSTTLPINEKAPEITTKVSQKNKTKPTETKEILKLNAFDFEDISSDENFPEISPNIKKLSDFESNKNLINEEDVSVTTTNDNQDSPHKHSNDLKSIDLPKKGVESDTENIQDLDLVGKVDIYFGSSESERNDDVVSSTSELTIYEVSQDSEKSRAEVSSSCNECDPQVNERSLQTSPISQDSLSPMLSPKMSRSSEDDKENKEVEKTSLLNQDIITSSEGSSALWINDAETENHIKTLDLEIKVDNSSQEKINNKTVLTKDTPVSLKCKIPLRRLSNALSSIRCNAPRLRSEVFKPSTPKLRISSSKNRAYSTSSTQRSQTKISSRRLSQMHSLDLRINTLKLKNQIQALRHNMPTIQGHNSLLHDRLINAGFLSERRNSFKQTEQISSAATTTEFLQNRNDSQNPIESDSCTQPLLPTSQVCEESRDLVIQPTPNVACQHLGLNQKTIETPSKTETTINKVAVEAANEALRQKTSRKTKHKAKELEVKTTSKKTERELNEKKSNQNIPDGEESNRIINNIEDVNIEIATRKRRKLSSSDSESKETHYGEPDTEKPPKVSIPNIKKRRKTINYNETSKLDISNVNEIKEFACKLVKPLLKEKSFEVFQNILENSQVKTKRSKSALPTNSRNAKYKVSSRELRALNKDLEESRFGDAVRKISYRRKSSINCLNALTAIKNAENSQNSESEEGILKKTTSNCSDEDYDTDSCKEYVGRKKKEKKMQKIIKNLPVVLVSKLSPKDLNSTKLTEADNLAENATTSKSKVEQHFLKPLKSIKIKRHSVRRKSQCAKTKSKEKKNTNTIWHYKDSFFSTSCILCSHKSSQLVQHYLKSHPQNEIYISRLPSADVRDLKKNPGRARRHLRKPHQYVAECFFCGQTMKGRFDKLSHHYATHTGELPYECSACTFISRKKADVVKHTKSECKKGGKLQICYSYDKNVTKINLYLCTKCNYMQLHKPNIIRHLQKEHDCNEIHETDAKTLTLLEFVDDPQQNIPVVNEPVSSDPKSDEEIVSEDQTGRVLPIMLQQEDNDTVLNISVASIDVKSEAILIDPCLGQSIEGSLSGDLSFSGVSTGLRLENPELLKTTTHEESIMAVTSNSEPKDNNSCNENETETKIDDVEELLQILTCSASTAPSPSNTCRTTDEHNATEDPANVESQKVIKENNRGDRKKSAHVEPQEIIEIIDDEDEDKKPIDFLKTENFRDAPLRVENCGYDEIRDSEYIFHCLIEKCDFGATVSFDIFQDHIKREHDVMWSGKCNVCKNKLIGLLGKQPIEEELNHMISVHIKELQDSQITDGYHVINVLKPWLNETRSLKKKMLCEGMVSEALLTNLYKCMGNDCSFTSDSKKQMSRHLANHELKSGKAVNQRPWLECCYCRHYADTPVQILEHVECGHSSALFQCSRCFYRSCSVVNVRNHQNQHHLHNIGKNTILKCNGNIKNITEDFKRIQKLKEDNIKAVSCSVCTQKYIRKDLMTKHFKTVHKITEIPKDLGMGLFSCIFCNFEDDGIMKMCYHMSNEHPEELLLIGVRGVKERSVESDISSIAAPEIKLGNIKPQPNNNISSSAGLAEHQSETNDLQKFRKNLMNMQELQNMCSQEKQNSETNGRALTELSTKMVKLLKYFINSEILHPCCICSKEINLENQWTDHFNTAHSTISRDVLWQCPQCPKMSSFWTYPVHFINHHVDIHKIYFCYFCAGHFYNIPAANKHLMTHICKEEESKCTYFKLSKESDADDDKINEIGIVIPETNNASVVEVIKHMIEISKKRKEELSKSMNVIHWTIDLNKTICGVNYPAYVPEKQRYVCSSCNNIWIDDKAFEKHFKTVHKTIVAFKCPHCDLLINPGNYEAVRDHLRLHSQEIIYQCYLCNMYTDNIELLVEHIKNYKQQSVPILRFTRNDKMQKYVYQIFNFSPLSTNRSSDKKIKCFFCPTHVGDYESLDMHLSNVHKMGRAYMCSYCTYQGDIKNVNSHIKEIHIKSDPKKVHFISVTVFLTIQSQEGNSSNLSDAQKFESTNNASCSKVVEGAQDVLRKRNYNDISDWPASDQNGEAEKRIKSENLEADKSENSDSIVKGGTTGDFNCNNYEDMSHTITSNESHLNSVNSSAQESPLPSSSNKAPTDPSHMILEGRQEEPQDGVRFAIVNAPQSSTLPKKRPLGSTEAIRFFTYKCFHCNTECNNYELLCAHWEFSDCPSKENQSYRFSIAQTEENFIFRHILNKIVETARKKSLYYRCSECSANFFSKDFCMHHMASKLLAPVYYCYNQIDILYGCDECNIFYNKEEQAIQHITKHTFPFLCIFCSAAYRSREEVHLHYRHTHYVNQRNYIYDAKTPRNMRIYQQMLVAFPCGLVLTKYYLRHTCWGNETKFTKLIIKSTKEDLCELMSWNFSRV